jgi:hypothetical protein
LRTSIHSYYPYRQNPNSTLSMPATTGWHEARRDDDAAEVTGDQADPWIGHARLEERRHRTRVADGVVTPDRLIEDEILTLRGEGLARVRGAREATLAPVSEANPPAAP